MRSVLWSSVFIVLCAGVLAAVEPSVINGKTFPGVDVSALSCNHDKPADRALCRVKLGLSGNLAFFPEQCILSYGQDKDDCLALQNALLPCRMKDTTDERELCWHETLGIGSFKGEYAKCMALQDVHRRKCLQDINVNIIRMADFRLDMLLDKAALAYRKGASESRVTGSCQRIEIARQKIWKAEAPDQRVDELKNLQRDWKLFVTQAMEDIRHAQ